MKTYAKTLLLAGTKKGLFLFSSADRRQWERSGPFQAGREINHAVLDPRDGRIWATANDSWFGCELASSPDLGKTWTNTPLKFPEASGTKLDRIWHIEPGRANQPGVLFAGVAPAALFRTNDGGQTWNEVTTLTQHPTRPHWHPGAGGLCLHSIVVDKNNGQRMFVGISAVGVFRTEDDGATWHPANKGTRAEFLPDKYPEFGQCVHKLLSTGGESPVLFQQNHCGVYRSSDLGKSWTEITVGLPSDFGFPLALHPRQPGTLYVLPLKGAEFRCPPEGKLRVFRSRDSGDTWQPLTTGLPQENVYAGIYREGMAADTAEPAGIYFGTNTGKIFHSADEGETWQLLADNLPPIYSVATGTVPD
jgi:photosystem II stability/assembly factor-like uncharacterized protein